MFSTDTLYKQSCILNFIFNLFYSRKFLWEFIFGAREDLYKHYFSSLYYIFIWASRKKKRNILINKFPRIHFHHGTIFLRSGVTFEILQTEVQHIEDSYLFDHNFLHGYETLNFKFWFPKEENKPEMKTAFQAGKNKFLIKPKVNLQIILWHQGLRGHQ